MQAFATVALALAPSAAQAGLRTLSPDEMRDDLFQLTEKLTSLHAGLHRYASGEEIDGAFSAALAAAEDGPHDVVQFYREVCALIAQIRCGHTRAQLGERDRATALARRGLLPFEVLLRGERAWIRRVLREGTGLRAGQEVLTIDGLTLAEIRSRAFACLSDDGFIETGKERQLEGEFAELFVLLVADPHPGPYELRLAGATGPVLVAGLAPADYAKLHETPQRPLVHFEILPGDDVGLLAIDAFGDRPSEPRFLEELEKSFRTLRERSIPHLVLDLRGNGGGRDMYGATLVSYLSPKAFGYFERIEVTPDYEGDVRIEERDGRRLMLSHPGLDVQRPNELHFRGDVAILIDGGTFSTAADVATVANANRLAKFFGEEAGGGYEGNNSGDEQRLMLHNSLFQLAVPEWNYTTAGVLPVHHGRGVVPDVSVSATIEDVLAGRDAVLERALESLRSKPGR